MSHLLSRGDRGVTLIEMIIAMAIFSLVGLAAASWLMAASTSDRFQEDATQSFDSLRQAKVAIVSELRFADGISHDAESTDQYRITVWIDRVDAGSVGFPETGVGEWVTWEITTDGRLMRTTDEPGKEAVEAARDLIVGESGSAFSYPAPGVVSIRLVADTMPSTASPQVIQTQVQLRNARP